MLRSTDIQKQLERGQILLKMTSCSSFENIKVLSLRDLQLTTVFAYISKCVNLQILFLSGNRISTVDIKKHMCKLKSVRKLDLSLNNLVDLPHEPSYFEKMESLEFLVLNDNNISSAENLVGLRGAPNLHYLSLTDNPIQENYLSCRYEIAGLLPGLLALDQNVVTYDEKIKHLYNRSIRYCSLSTFSKLDEATTRSFVADFPASKHLQLF